MSREEHKQYLRDLTDVLRQHRDRENAAVRAGCVTFKLIGAGKRPSREQLEQAILAEDLEQAMAMAERWARE